MELIEDLAIPTRAAAMCGIPQQTLSDAIRLGKVASDTLGDGTVVVRLSDVRRWDAERQKGRGRPAKSS